MAHLASELLQLSAQKKKQKLVCNNNPVKLSAKPKPKKALVFWTDEGTTSIVDQDDVVNQCEFVVGKITNVKWKIRGKKVAIYEAKILEIGELPELKIKQVEVNEGLSKCQEDSQTENAQDESMEPSKRGRKIPSILSDFILTDDEDEPTEKRKVVSKSKEQLNKEHNILVAERQKEANKVFSLPPLWSEWKASISKTNCTSAFTTSIPCTSASTSLFSTPSTSIPPATLTSASTSQSSLPSTLTPQFPMPSTSTSQYLMPSTSVSPVPTSSTALCIRNAMEILDPVEPIVTFPQSQPTDLDFSVNSSVSATSPMHLPIQYNNTEQQGLSLLNLDEQHPMDEDMVEKMKGDLAKKEARIKELEQQLQESIQRNRTSCTCQVLSNAGLLEQAFVRNLLNTMTQGSCMPEASGRILNAQTHVFRDNNVFPRKNMVELHAGSDVWVSAQDKSLAILQANGKPEKLIANALGLLFSKKKLATFSMNGQRVNESIPRKEANAIKEFVLNICRQPGGAPALTNSQFCKAFNRRFAIARQSLKCKETVTD